MATRREFLQATAISPFLLHIIGCQSASETKAGLTSDQRNQANGMKNDLWRMPEEGEPHKRTWMAFGPSTRVWGRRLIGEVRQNLVKVAEAIAKFEPVVMCVRSR